MRSLLQVLACILLGLLAGSAIMFVWRGYEPTVDLLNALLQYIYAEQSLAP